MGDPRLHPVETFPQGMDVRSERFRALLNAVAGWAHGVSNLNAVGMPHEVSPEAIEIGAPTPRRSGGQKDTLAIITASTANGNRWDYTVSYPAEKSAAGYGNWQAASGATSVTARNLWEDVDPTTRISQDPDGDSTNEVTIDPLPNNSIVLIRKISDGAGSTEWWIVGGGIPNDVSVNCGS